jgi:hypothetical protein
LSSFLKAFGCRNSCGNSKQRSGYALKKATGVFAWQISYYDHVLRKEEALLDVAQYIWDNPVKEGIVDDPRDSRSRGRSPWRNRCDAGRAE